jgi:hypothetical protein
MLGCELVPEDKEPEDKEDFFCFFMLFCLFMRGHNSPNQKERYM